MIQLDVLRGIAILLVLARHSPVPWSFAGFARPVMLVLWRLGWTGVDLFFVLSGFLIGGLLFKEIRTTGRLDVRRFLVRRGLKIWPAYFVYIGFVFFAMAHAVGFGRSFQAVLPNLLHLQNYLGTPRGQTWSLAVEEHFYLVLPLFLLLMLAIGRRRGRGIAFIPATAAILIVGCTLLRVFLNWHRPFQMFTEVTATHLRIDGLFFGVLIAYLYHLRPEFLARVARHRLLLLIAGLALISPMALYDISDQPFIWTVGFTMLYLGYGLLLIAFVHTPPGEGVAGKLMASRAARLIAWIGIFSYSIYLWQFDLAVGPVERWVLPHLPRHHLTLLWLLGSAIYLMLAILGGALAAKIVEIPGLALRDRLFPPRVAGSAVSRISNGTAPAAVAKSADAAVAC